MEISTTETFDWLFQTLPKSIQKKTIKLDLDKQPENVEIS